MMSRSRAETQKERKRGGEKRKREREKKKKEKCRLLIYSIQIYRNINVDEYINIYIEKNEKLALQQKGYERKGEEKRWIRGKKKNENVRIGVFFLFSVEIDQSSFSDSLPFVLIYMSIYLYIDRQIDR